MQTAHAAAIAAPQSNPVDGDGQQYLRQQDAAKIARLEAFARQHADTLAHYTPEQLRAIRRIYETVKVHVGTSGGNTCAKLLLGLYNGERFPFDLTNLRSLDRDLFAHAMTVLTMDARQTWCEVHVLLDAIYADGCSTGMELELWAFNMRYGKRCKREAIDGLKVRGVDRRAYFGQGDVA